MRIFLSAGEASGDAYGAGIVREMKRLRGVELTFEGIGGKRMRAAGVTLHADSAIWGAISISQSLKIYPRVVRGYYETKSQFAQGTPGLFIPIDFGFANIRLARHAKKHGWKVLYFVPPGSWRRDRQGGDLVTLTDAVSTPFKWSAEILNRMGANAHWFGHPIKQLLRDSLKPVESQNDLAVLPGSRLHEIAENLPLVAEALKNPALASIPVTFALAPSVDENAFRVRWQSLTTNRENDRFVIGDTYGVLRAARAAIVCSGTATLEAALCRCPMVVVYRVSRTVEIEAKILRFKRPQYIALPNILLQRPCVPELLQDEATAAATSETVLALWQDGPAREAQLAGFDELDALLGPSDAITKTAELALSLV